MFVDPHDTSIEALSTQVSEILGMQPNDFPDEAEVVCAACEAEVPYRLALVATHRADAHAEDREALAKAGAKEESVLAYARTAISSLLKEENGLLLLMTEVGAVLASSEEEE